jgi:hypothetical protein
MPPVGFEPRISAGERLKTYALDRAATATGDKITNIILKYTRAYQLQQVPVAEQFKAWVCDRSLAGITGSNPSGGMDVCLF